MCLWAYPAESGQVVVNCRYLVLHLNFLIPIIENKKAYPIVTSKVVVVSVVQVAGSPLLGTYKGKNQNLNSIPKNLQERFLSAVHK